MLIDRLRVLWGILGSIIAFIVALILFHHLRPLPALEDTHSILDPTTKSAILNAPIPDMAKEDILSLTTRSSSPMLETSLAQPLLEDDERLRGFDEL